MKNSPQESSMVMEINSNINNDLDLNAENIKAQMRKGVLEYCILSILRKGDSYVSPLIAELKAAKMIVVEGTLYPLLTRQKNQGLLSYRWRKARAVRLENTTP